jgi:hypothetical protein
MSAVALALLFGQSRCRKRLDPKSTKVSVRQPQRCALDLLQSIKFEMAINLQTAKALGLKLSDNLLSIADEVIE